MVVGVSTIGAPAGPRLISFLPQFPIGREGQERLDRGAQQRDDVAALKPAFACRLRRRLADVVGQAVQIGFLQHKLPGLFVRLDMLAEQRGQRRHPLRNSGHAELGILVQCGAATDEPQIAALQQAHLVGFQTQFIALRVEVGDAGEQSGVQRDLRVVLRQLGAVIAGNRLKLLVGVAGVQVEEHRAHPVEQPTRMFHRLDRIGEGRGFGRAGDGLEIGQPFFHATVERRWKMLRLDQIERGKTECVRPGREEGISGGHQCLMKKCSFEDKR